MPKLEKEFAALGVLEMLADLCRTCCAMLGCVSNCRFYGTEFPHFTRSLFRPRLVVHTVDDSCPEAEVGLFPLAVSTISTTLTNGQTVLLREDDSEDEDQLRKKKASTRSLRDFEADDELRRRRKRHEVESALNFPAFMRLYFTLDRLVSHERVAVSNYLGAVVSCCR